MLSRFAALATLGGHARARNLLMACGLVIGLVLASAAAWFVAALRANDISDAERELKNLSFILSEELDRRLQGLDLLQLGLIEHMQQLGIDIAGIVQATDDVFRGPPGPGAPDCRPAPRRGSLIARRRREADQLLALLAGSGYRCPRPRLHQGAAGPQPAKDSHQPAPEKQDHRPMDHLFQPEIRGARRAIDRDRPQHDLHRLFRTALFQNSIERWQLLRALPRRRHAAGSLPAGGSQHRDDVRPYREFQSLACRRWITALPGSPARWTARTG